MSDAAFYIGVVALIVLFAGEPDLHDALVKWMMSTGCKP